MTRQEFQEEITKLKAIESKALKAKYKAKKDTELLIKEYLKEEDTRKEGDVLEHPNGFILLIIKRYELHFIDKTPIIVYCGQSCNKKGKLVSGGKLTLIYSYDLMN
jgi:hypothetical protein